MIRHQPRPARYQHAPANCKALVLPLSHTTPTHVTSHTHTHCERERERDRPFTNTTYSTTLRSTFFHEALSVHVRARAPPRTRCDGTQLVGRQVNPEGCNSGKPTRPLARVRIVPQTFPDCQLNQSITMERRRGSTQNLVSRLLTNSNTSKPAHKQVKTQARLQNDTAHVRQVAGHGGLESVRPHTVLTVSVSTSNVATCCLPDVSSGIHVEWYPC